MLSKKIAIASIVSPDLALRLAAQAFFDNIETYPEEHITIDFSNVTTMTRSFAHEYLCRKAETSKEIQEINIPANIQEMFTVVCKKPEGIKKVSTGSVVTLGL